MISNLKILNLRVETTHKMWYKIIKSEEYALDTILYMMGIPQKQRLTFGPACSHVALNKATQRYQIERYRMNIQVRICNDCT